jgi:hypothetical protein
MCTRAIRPLAIVLLLCACAGSYQSVRTDTPATRAELAEYPVSVADPALRDAMARAGFTVVERAPYKGELQLTKVGQVATLRSDGFFVDKVRGDPVAIAEALAASSRVAEFVRNSGTVEQRQMPGM